MDDFPRHYRIVVAEVMETVYEVWARSEEEALVIAETNTEISHPKRYQVDATLHRPHTVHMTEVRKYHQC